MGRSPCCEKVGLKKGPWTPEEDQKLLAYIQENGHGSWRALPINAGLQRCGKSCRLRWTNYLRPDIKRGKFSHQEEQTIIQLHALLGNRWSAIAGHLPKRTDNEIKNYWNTHLKKRLTKMGIDPITHKPKTDMVSSSSAEAKPSSFSHMAQWESARLEAEARLVRESKLRSSSKLETVRTVLWQGKSSMDLESPTSTLNFSAAAAAGSATAVSQNLNRMTMLNDNRTVVPGFSVGLQTTVFSTAEDSSRKEFVHEGFTGMLLEDADGCKDYSLERAAADSDNADELYGSCIEEEDNGGNEDESSNYWNNILNLVSSPTHAHDSSSPNEPPTYWK